ncbi:MAG: hypothetical protein EON93_09550 [Burkholderiales bacterium]|nr:MAG: hypothetical protein EON93_09550 [Burkholderiales bacterium]
MTRIAYFGHDAFNGNLRRRVQGFKDDGLDVVGFMMRRRDEAVTGWDNVDLGRTYDGAFGQRIRSIFKGAKLAAAQRDKLASADVIFARSLDMLATAFLAKRYAKLKTPVVYEVLDVHRMLTGNGPISFVMRRIEGALLARCKHLVVSSPGFLTNYFEVRHKNKYRATVIENRLALGEARDPRPVGPKPQTDDTLRIGWVGVLRCKRSMNLLLDAARTFGPQVKLVMHGMPALSEIPDFHERIAGLPNVEFHGRYRSPDDLSRIYDGLDVVWAGDFMEAGYNSVWLLPNRIYEGGYFAVPPIAPSGTQTAKWIGDNDTGFLIPEDLATTLPDMIRSLIADRKRIADKRAHMLALPTATFVSPRGELAVMIDAALNTNTTEKRAPQNGTREARKTAG